MAQAGPIVLMRAEGLRAALKRSARLVALVRFVRALATPLGRGRLGAMRRGTLLQPATVTRMDRHPALFALLKARLADNPAPRLLSFGCATGEEAFTLARYLPTATIDAIDANPAAIARAQASGERMHPRRIRFLRADTPDAAAPALYDAVLCLSVLRHGDLDWHRPPHSTALMPFARFAGVVAALDARVRPGGLLVLWGCNFRFADTDMGHRYDMVPVAMKPQPGPYYGPDDRLLPDDACVAFVFAKRSDAR